MELELESVGYYADKLTNVCWYETFENVTLRRAAIVNRYVTPISCKRDKATKVNKVKFELEEGKIYRYSRQISVKPRQEESRCFKVVGSEICFLDDEVANPHLAYSARGFSVMGTCEVNQAIEYVAGTVEQENVDLASTETKSQFLEEERQEQDLTQISTNVAGNCSVTITRGRDESEFDSSKLQGMATPKQVAYLSFMGVHNATSLSKREAADLIESNSFLPEVDTMAAFLRQQSLKSSWTFQRLVLYPELYSSELADFLDKDLPDELHAYARGQIVGSSERLTKSKIKEVMGVLLKEDSTWWHSSYRKAIFHDRLKIMYPGCCDGRSAI
jgi:hypothetical protein